MKKYPKFKSKDECAFPERDNCNYDEFDPKSERCPYMKFFSLGNWHCIYEKSLKSDTNQVKPTSEKVK